MRIAIHQPNFFPHSGFFDKMKEVDLFVLLTFCQFEKNNYQNRFNVDDKWHTMSVLSGNYPIIAKMYNKPQEDWNKIKVNLPDYDLTEFDECIAKPLATTNIDIIRKIAKKLGIKTEIVLDYPTELTATDRLVDICKTHKATTYLSGISGINYMDLEAFEREGVKVEYQQKSASTPIIDLI